MLADFLFPIIQKYKQRQDLICYGFYHVGNSYKNITKIFHGISYSVKFSHSVMSDSLRPHGLQHSRLPYPPIHQLPELAQTHIHWVSDAIQPSHVVSSPSPPAFNFPSIRVFSNKSVLHIRWPKYWTFNFSISPSSEYSGLFSFRMDCLDLLAVQGILKSLLQHHKSKASILRCSASVLFTVQLSYRRFRLWLY